MGHEGAPAWETGAVGGGFWSDTIWIPCTDGKARRIKPGIQPLAHGVSGRVGLLRGAGNAIVSQAAAQFIQAFMPDACGDGGRVLKPVFEVEFE